MKLKIKNKYDFKYFLRNIDIKITAWDVEIKYNFHKKTKK